MQGLGEPAVAACELAIVDRRPPPEAVRSQNDSSTVEARARTAWHDLDVVDASRQRAGSAFSWSHIRISDHR